MYLLDSSIIIDFLKNVPSVVQTIAKLDDSISSSYICLSELYEGIFRQKTKEKIENTEKQIISFFEELDKIWALDEHIAREFGKIRTYLKETGKIIEDIDIFIAATCLVHNLTLVTINVKHFQRIKNLKMYPT